MIWSAQEMSKKFRMSLGKNISPRSIHVFAEKLGYHMKRVGGKKGYDQSLYTALTRHLKELLDYNSQQTVKTPQKPQKQSNLGDYYTYNGERDNIDYEWEKNEEYDFMYMKKRIIKEGAEVINNINVACKIIRDQWSSPDDYWYLFITQRVKDNFNVVDDNGNSIFSSKGWDDGNEKENRIGYAVIMGNTVEEAVNSLLNPRIKIFGSVTRYVGTNEIQGNDGRMDSVIELCKKFNARAYLSQYKRSYKEFTDPKKFSISRFTPSEIKSLYGKTDDESLKRIFHYVNVNRPKPSRPFYLIDCDDEDPRKQQQVLDQLSKVGLSVAYAYQTHAGVHYLVDLSTVANSPSARKDLAKNLNTYFRSLYGKEEEKGDHLAQTNPIEIERDKNIILYSEVGVNGRNVANPEWQKGLNFRANMPTESIMRIVNNVINEFIRREFNVI